MEKDKVIPAHIEKLTGTAYMIVPEHADRTESPEFRSAVKRLKEDGHYVCWMSGLRDGDKRPDGTIVDLQVHHLFMEYCLAADCDFDKLKRMAEEWDIYGYGRLMRNTPITSIDDIRQMLCLDVIWHIGGATDGVANGIHFIPFPYWISQKIALAGKDPVPENTADLKADEAAAGIATEP
jgi:hypothetical protein